ncbi:MAG: hypothetical protein Hyperionvirus5_43 [Hyperionvirus sp.]|uniref:Uncharacterized protein n=1 Tax=Hyperionvirus sp. TaxID=2487770 RepID=A0A3G5A7L6_9VIRU|nr:MAG: hypothetical protein Hyperionvirus5_43 [Hyperionvirus sp.]
MAAAPVEPNIISWPISIFPTRLQPIFYDTRDAIIIIDFLNGRLISINKKVLPAEFNRCYLKEIYRDNDKIYINALGKKVICADVEWGVLIATGNESLSEKEEEKTICRTKFRNNSIIDWGDGSTLDCFQFARLRAIMRNGERLPGMFMTNRGMMGRLIKLHPKKNDLTEFYKKYFCCNDGNSLVIGSIHNDVLHSKQITDPFFDKVNQFYLMEDNVLMLVIIIEVKGVFSQRLMFVDCDEVIIVGCIELPRDIPRLVSAADNFTELKPIRRDFLRLQTKFILLLPECIIPPLAQIVFIYIFGNMP